MSPRVESTMRAVSGVAVWVAIAVAFATFAAGIALRARNGDCHSDTPAHVRR